MSQLSPIVLFVYNRPLHTKKTIEALLKNDLCKDSNIFIFSDGAKNNLQKNKINEVRTYLKSITGFNSITIKESETNLGLANSVINGITEVLQTNESAIVLEDDIITVPTFLNYINECINKYAENKNIFSVTGYNFPPSQIQIPAYYKLDVYIHPRAASWGWATWKDRWEKADWEVKNFNLFLKNKALQLEYNKTGPDKSRMLIRQMKGEIDSWAIRWDYTHFLNKAYCIYPVRSFINNIGTDGSGRHFKKTNKYFNDITTYPIHWKLPSYLEPDEVIIKKINSIFKGGGKKFKIKTFFENLYSLLK